MKLLLRRRSALTESPVVFPPRAGVGRRAAVDPPQPGGELEVRAHQHRPENRLQVQRRGHDGADGPQQRAVPGPRGRGRLQAPGRPAPCSMVPARLALLFTIHALIFSQFTLFFSIPSRCNP